MSVTYKAIACEEFKSAVSKMSQVERDAFTTFKLMKWVKNYEFYLKEIQELYNKLLLDEKKKDENYNPLNDPHFIKVLESDCGLKPLECKFLEGVNLTVREVAVLEHAIAWPE